MQAGDFEVACADSTVETLTDQDYDAFVIASSELEWGTTETYILSMPYGYAPFSNTSVSCGADSAEEDGLSLDDVCWVLTPEESPRQNGSTPESNSTYTRLDGFCSEDVSPNIQLDWKEIEPPTPEMPLTRNTRGIGALSIFNCEWPCIDCIRIFLQNPRARSTCFSKKGEKCSDVVVETSNFTEDWMQV